MTSGVVAGSVLVLLDGLGLEVVSGTTEEVVVLGVLLVVDVLVDAVSRLDRRVVAVVVVVVLAGGCTTGGWLTTAGLGASTSEGATLVAAGWSPCCCGPGPGAGGWCDSTTRPATKATAIEATPISAAGARRDLALDS